jgi:TatD DNase family protein
MNESIHLFDAHCHLQDAAFDEDREAMFAESRAAGVSHFLVPATDSASFAATLNFANTHEHVFCALGIHPHSANEWSAETREQIRTAVRDNDKIVAIGEIGLDYHYDFSPRNIQQQAFSEQIALAIELKKPIVIHTRESEEDVFRIVEEQYSSVPVEVPRGQFHCFSAGVDWMKRAVSLGFYVSFTGNITFKNSNLEEVVRDTPLDRLLIETDSPYLAPAPNRGKRNSPAMLPFIAQKAAELRKQDISIIMQQTFANALSLFRPTPGIVQKTFGALLLALGLFIGAANVYAQQPTQPGGPPAGQPAGTAPPDSILTGERRKAEELRNKQAAELAREAEQHRQDSIKNAQQEQLDAQAKAREQIREDSVRVAQQMSDEARHAAFLLTPEPWRAIGLGVNVGVASIPGTAVNSGILSPTSVFAGGFQIRTEVTRRLDIAASFTHSEFSESFPSNYIFNYTDTTMGGGPPTKPQHPYSPGQNYLPNITRMLQNESLGISVIGLDLDYTITRPASVIKFYFGIGFQHYMMASVQNYLFMKDSLNTAPGSHTYEQDWSRNGIDIVFGAKGEIELGNGLTLEPYAEVSATGIFNGPTQFGSFVFQPLKTTLITDNVRAGFTVYFGWWGVPRQ